MRAGKQQGSPHLVCKEEGEKTNSVQARNWLVFTSDEHIEPHASRSGSDHVLAEMKAKSEYESQEPFPLGCLCASERGREMKGTRIFGWWISG
jgi:hypothetical protein